MSSDIPDIIKRPQEFLAPKFISTFLQGVEVGFILSQQWAFWSTSDSPARTRAVVVMLLLLGLFQVVISAQDLWRTTTTGFGDLPGVFSWSWKMKMQLLLTTLIAIPVQSFLTWRCWILSGRRSIILVVLCPLVLSYLAASMTITVRAFSPTSGTMVLSLEGFHNSEVTVDPGICVCLIIPALLDIILTSISLYQYFRSRSGIVNPRFQKVLSSLPLVIWRSAIPPCGCAIVAVTLYIATDNTNFWPAAFQDVLGKLYLITFLVCLNAKTYFPELNSTTPWNERSKEDSLKLKRTPGACKSRSTSFDKGRKTPELSVLRFATLSQTSHGIEVDSVLGQITSEFEESDLGTRTSSLSWWAEQYELRSWSFEASRNSTVVRRESMGSWT